MEKKLVIHHFTDPLCFWCYAMEPEIRKIRMLLGDQADYRIVMGVLSSDVHDMIGYDADAEVRALFIRNMLADGILEAARRVGMPISVDHMLESDLREFVSLPLSMAYCAMLMIDEDLAEGYLRRMRECVYAEGRSLLGIDAQVELAGEFIDDVDWFRRNLEGDEVASVLQQGVAKCRTYRVNAFPTLMLQYGGKFAAVQGYRSYDDLKQAIAQLTDGDIVLSDAEFSLSALEAYLERFGKAAAREVQTMFSLNDAQLANVMMDLVSTGRYKTETCGTGYFVMKK